LREIDFFFLSAYLVHKREDIWYTKIHNFVIYHSHDINASMTRRLNGDNMLMTPDVTSQLSSTVSMMVLSLLRRYLDLCVYTLIHWQKINRAWTI